MGKPGRPKLPVRSPGQRGRLPGQKPKKKGRDFSKYIFKVHRAAGNQTRIKKGAMKVLNSMVNELFKRICTEAREVLEISKKQIINAEALRTSVKMIFPKDMCQFALEEGDRAVLKHTQYEQADAFSFETASFGTSLNDI